MSTTVEEKALDDFESKIRTREAEAHPTTTKILSAVVYARQTSGMGLHLENACPYIRTRHDRKECEPMPTSGCIGKENYRGCPIYQVMITKEALEEEKAK
jgi:hypothetical protein